VRAPSDLRSGATGSHGAVMLEASDIEAIAERVAEKLRSDGFGRYGDAHAVCARFGVSPDFVYAHAVRLGAIRLGEGPKARLRFDLAEVERRLSGNAPATKSEPPPRARRAGRRKQRNAVVELIPFEP
jgi:hypothetical protein